MGLRARNWNRDNADFGLHIMKTENTQQEALDAARRVQSYLIDPQCFLSKAKLLEDIATVVKALEVAGERRV